MHHDGTKRHPIVAKPGRMLTFTSNGKRIYARKVLHLFFINSFLMSH
jgi:hypothetical protein